MTMPSDPGEHLARHKAGLGQADCSCPFGWLSYGRAYGQDMGEGWVRVGKEPGCVHHSLNTSREKIAAVLG